MAAMANGDEWDEISETDYDWETAKAIAPRPMTGSGSLGSLGGSDSGSVGTAPKANRSNKTHSRQTSWNAVDDDDWSGDEEDWRPTPNRPTRSQNRGGTRGALREPTNSVRTNLVGRSPNRVGSTSRRWSRSRAACKRLAVLVCVIGVGAALNSSSMFDGRGDLAFGTAHDTTVDRSWSSMDDTTEKFHSDLRDSQTFDDEAEQIRSYAPSTAGTGKKAPTHSFHRSPDEKNAAGVDASLHDELSSADDDNDNDDDSSKSSGETVLTGGEKNIGADDANLSDNERSSDTARPIPSAPVVGTSDIADIEPKRTEEESEDFDKSFGNGIDAFLAKENERKNAPRDETDVVVGEVVDMSIDESETSTAIVPVDTNTANAVHGEELVVAEVLEASEGEVDDAGADVESEVDDVGDELSQAELDAKAVGEVVALEASENQSELVENDSGDSSEGSSENDSSEAQEAFGEMLEEASANDATVMDAGGEDEGKTTEDINTESADDAVSPFFAEPEEETADDVDVAEEGGAVEDVDDTEESVEGTVTAEVGTEEELRDPKDTTEALPSLESSKQPSTSKMKLLPLPPVPEDGPDMADPGNLQELDQFMAREKYVAWAAKTARLEGRVVAGMKATATKTD